VKDVGPYQTDFLELARTSSVPLFLETMWVKPSWVCMLNMSLYIEDFFIIKTYIIESVDYICRDSADTQYILIQTNLSKSPKQLTYKPL